MGHLAAFLSFIVLAATSAWAQVPTPAPGAEPAPAEGGIADWWWLILLVIIAAVAIWYFARRNRSM